MHRYIDRFSSERNYANLLSEISGVVSPDKIHYVREKNPEIWAVIVKNDERNKYVFLSAGVHGDEPAGIEALVEFLKIADSHSQFNFVILPCVNPVGYEKNIREGSNFQDINREFFYGTESHENKSVMRFLDRLGIRDYLFSMDLHETREDDGENKDPSLIHPDGFYLFEVPGAYSAGSHISHAVSSIMPVCNWSKIWGDSAISGVVSYPEDMGKGYYYNANTFEKYMRDHYTRHSMTIETYSGKYGGNGDRFEDRIKCHLVSIKSALEIYSWETKIRSI